MNNNMGNVPNLANSSAVDQNEIQKAKNRMGNNGAAGQGMTSAMPTGGMGMPTGATTNLANSTEVDQLEVQQAKQKVQNSGVQNTTY